MPPKAKITKEMIIDAAFEIARTEGADKITARSISEKLKCSTQPVLYYFSSVEEIKAAVYQKADLYHSDFIMDMSKDYGNPMLTIGMNYIRFSMEERKLFQFLFQSNEFSGSGLMELIQQENAAPFISVLQEELGTTEAEALEIFSTLFIFVHGYASMFANNELTYEEEELLNKLDKVFYGAICAEQATQAEEE